MDDDKMRRAQIAARGYGDYLRIADELAAQTHHTRSDLLNGLLHRSARAMFDLAYEASDSAQRLKENTPTPAPREEPTNE